MKRSPMKRSRVKATDPKSVAVVKERSGGGREARLHGCTGRLEHVHHTLLRSQGAGDDPALLLGVCRSCHESIHAHPAFSYERGFLRHRESA